ncbi:MAG: protein-tyrosine-phosphatase [Chitinophagales bacterium]
MFEKLTQYCTEIGNNFDTLSVERKAALTAFSEKIKRQFIENGSSKIIVICTHNSRRSHLGQLWLQIAADFYQVKNIETFSGGTEATALNERVVSCLKNIGFEIESDNLTPENPIYAIQWQTNMAPYMAFSKKYDTKPNPKNHFIAVMVCTSADEGCPIVSGAEYRVSLPFDDPKDFDDTPLEKEKYAERCFEIATEMFYTISLLK